MRGGPGGRPGGPGGPRGDQTMIARSPLADMPTQMHRPVSGPHGGPPPAGYGQNPYASNPAGGQGGGGGYQNYPGGAPPNYGQPDPYGNAYGPHQGGYGGPPPQGGHDQGGHGRNEHDPRGPRPGSPDRRVDWLED
jgi:hypothetical protein